MHYLRLSSGGPRRVVWRPSAAQCRDSIHPAPADTSVWIQFFRSGDSELRTLLEEGLVAVHDFVLGELACWNLRDRSGAISE